MELLKTLCVVGALTALSACSSDSDNNAAVAQGNSAADGTDIAISQPLEDAPETGNTAMEGVSNENGETNEAESAGGASDTGGEDSANESDDSGGDVSAGESGNSVGEESAGEAGNSGEDDTAGETEGDNEASNTNDIINSTNYISLLTATSDILGNALRDSPISELDIAGFAAVPDTSESLTNFSCLTSGSLDRAVEVEVTESAEITTTSYDASDCNGPVGSWDGTYAIRDYVETDVTSGFQNTNRCFDIELVFSDESSISATGSVGSSIDGSVIDHSFDMTRYVASDASGITSVIGSGIREDLYFEPVESRLGFTAQLSGDTVYAADPSVVLTVSATPPGELFGFNFDASGNFTEGEIVVTATDGSEVIARSTPDTTIALIKLTGSDNTTIEENRPWTSIFDVQ